MYVLVDGFTVRAFKRFLLQVKQDTVVIDGIGSHLPGSVHYNNGFMNVTQTY